MNLLEQTENAIKTFYHCESSVERNAAHHWLVELQKSTEGWHISWMLLEKQKTVEIQYYGASILHHKISRCIKDISQDQWAELKTKFIGLLSLFHNGPKVILSKLCLAYLAFIIQVADKDFELLWCLEEVEKHFKTLGNEAKLIILEILTAFPSEFKSLALYSSQKVLVRNFMNRFTSTMLLMCKNILQEVAVGKEAHTRYQIDTLTCLFNWIEFGICLADSTELLPILFSNVSSNDLSDKVCEVLIDFITAPTSYSLEETIFSVLQQALQLQELIEKSFLEENHDLLNNLCMIFTSIGETHCRFLLKTTDASNQLAVLNLVKLFSGLHL